MFHAARPTAADPQRPDRAHGSAAGACAIPPHVYDIAFSWDPTPEINRLLHLAREHSRGPTSALELGCGAGRLLAALAPHCARRAGIELSPEMAALARTRSAADIVVGDMCAPPRDPALDEPFDLVYCSANTIRHALSPEAIDRLWRGVAERLAPGGLFVADLELGIELARSTLNKPSTWFLSRGDVTVHASWTVVAPADEPSRCCEIEWEFVARGGPTGGTWRQRFPLRTYEPGEFVALAERGGALRRVGVFELRDPYLLERPLERIAGRCLAAFRRVGCGNCGGSRP